MVKERCPKCDKEWDTQMVTKRIKNDETEYVFLYCKGCEHGELYGYTREVE